MNRPHPADIGVRWTLYDLCDRIYGTRIGATLNELLIKGLMDFLDEGQSAWRMPARRQGLFRAWSQIARRNRRLRLRGIDVATVLDAADGPEAVISLVLGRLEVPEALWSDYFTRELTRLPGWAGFVRWRCRTRDYYWQERNPADLVDLLAVRLALCLPLLEDAGRQLQRDIRYPAWVTTLTERAEECLLRQELHAGTILPDYAHRVEVALDANDQGRIRLLCAEYEREKTRREAATQAERLLELCERAGIPRAEVARLPSGRLRQLIEAVAAFHQREGQVWTDALERTYMRGLLARLAANVSARAATGAARAAGARNGGRLQALFCIDARSERLRRHLECVGRYDTFGIAGFFGVPVSFIEFGKGHEAALCPPIVTPSNVALELPHRHIRHQHALFHLATEVVHDLKATVLAPYVTVEAVGLLFGADMLGKTLAPASYHRWRARLGNSRQPARLMIDKLSREEALDLIASLQDEMIIRAVERHFGIKRESLTTSMIAELRAIALGEARGPSRLARRFDITAASETVFLTSLRHEYRINPDEKRLQLEQLGRIGFRPERQAELVGAALKAIGLVDGFAKIVLVVGHASTSQNNPYESTLDCGACGGESGLTNARIFAAMANRQEVRARLAADGLMIPEDCWFVPALHNTTTDDITLHDLDQVPPGRLAQLTRIQEDLAAAGRRCALERCKTLAESGVPTPEAATARVRRNAWDWTQVRPEWGLSHHAAFIIGRRDLTRRIDLAGRVFLHSYDYRLDQDGTLLEGILVGPLIVAYGINMAYFFATVDNEVFGSGSKAYHNVVGRFGVMTGNLSDLRIGLPWQSLYRRERPYHEPMRLITVIEAPLPLVEGVLSRVFKVRQLVLNGWLRLLVIDQAAGQTFWYQRHGWARQSWPLGTLPPMPAPPHHDRPAAPYKTRSAIASPS